MDNFKDLKVVRLAVDAIIEKNKKILLIKRKYPPYGWALPGGFVEYGESVEEAVVRELKEETGLDIRNISQFHVYSDPQRDPRGIHVASVVFIANASGNLYAGDDAKEARFFFPDEFPELAFDHEKILADYLNRTYPTGKALPEEN